MQALRDKTRAAMMGSQRLEQNPVPGCCWESTTTETSEIGQTRIAVMLCMYSISFV